MKENEITNNLKEIRIRNGIMQKTLSEKTGISIVSISRFENGERSLQNAVTETSLKFAAALGCSVEDLFKKNCDKG